MASALLGGPPSCTVILVIFKQLPPIPLTSWDPGLWMLGPQKLYPSGSLGGGESHICVFPAEVSAPGMCHSKTLF